MHNLSPKIEEVMEFQRVLSIKQHLENNLSLEIMIERLCLDPWNKYFPTSTIFADLHTCRDSHEDEIMFWRQGLIRLHKFLKKCWLKHPIHNTQELEEFKLWILFWIPLKS
jgi:hypothetical protein